MNKKVYKIEVPDKTASSMHLFFGHCPSTSSIDWVQLANTVDFEGDMVKNLFLEVVCLKKGLFLTSGGKAICFKLSILTGGYTLCM